MKKETMQSRERWEIRRKVIFGTLGFSALVITYFVFYGTDKKIQIDITNGLLMLCGSVIGSYIFGATWDDKNHK